MFYLSKDWHFGVGTSDDNFDCLFYSLLGGRVKERWVKFLFHIMFNIFVLKNSNLSWIKSGSQCFAVGLGWLISSNLTIGQLFQEAIINGRFGLAQ